MAAVPETNDASADLSGAGPDADDVPVDGRRSRWAAHRAARRDELIAATIRAVSKYGAGVGMDQIAAVANTSKPVIYRYFADKTDLYRAVSARVVGTVSAALQQTTVGDIPARELIHHSVDAYLGLLEAYPELYRFIVQHPFVDGAEGTPAAFGAGFGADFSTVVATLLRDRLGEQLRRGGLDPSYASPWGEAIVGFINAASLWWLDHRDVMTRAQLGNYLASLLWGGAAGVYQLGGFPADPRPERGVFPPLEPTME